MPVNDISLRELPRALKDQNFIHVCALYVNDSDIVCIHISSLHILDCSRVFILVRTHMKSSLSEWDIKLGSDLRTIMFGCEFIIINIPICPRC